jgi:hypothetical protein
MGESVLLASITDLIGKQADLLFALVNFYAIVVIAVIGWIVNTGKDGPGVSWFRVSLFLLGFLAFFIVAFGAIWLLYERLGQTMGVWADLARRTGEAPPTAVARLASLPPQNWLWGLWGFNALILILATVLLRQGGFGKRPKPIVSDSRDRDTRIGFDGR